MREQLIDQTLQALTSDPAEERKPEDWRTWLLTHFPNVCTKPFGRRHQATWEWFSSIKPGEPQNPRLEVWPRGGAKSSTGELGTAYVGARLARKFCLYVSETQDQADKHVQAVATMLESLGYRGAVNIEGHSKGWRHNILRTDHGFNVAAFGLDKGVRGVKLDEFRPDFFIIDDIDGRNDTPAATKKKENTITQTLLPAGSSDAVTLFLQNLIIEDGMVARMVEGRADYLLNAIIVGPEPAIIDLEVEDDVLPNGRPYKRIVSGSPTWEGQDLAVCQKQIIEWGWTAFKREAQHQVAGADGLFFDVSQLRYCDPADIPLNLVLARAWDLAATQAGGDFTAGPLLGYDRETTLVYVIDVKREQYASNDVRDLIDRTAQADNAGEIYGADKKHESGAFKSRGEFRFRFPVGKTPRLLVPEDPGQAGKAQAQQFEDDLGEDNLLAAVRPTGRKSVRARGFQSAVNDNRVVLVRGEWNHYFVDELRRFREDEKHDFDDQVDGSSDAYNELVPKPAPPGYASVSTSRVVDIRQIQTPPAPGRTDSLGRFVPPPRPRR